MVHLPAVTRQAAPQKYQPRTSRPDGATTGAVRSVKAIYWLSWNGAPSRIASQ